jgi:hypothetical protein
MTFAQLATVAKLADEGDLQVYTHKWVDYNHLYHDALSLKQPFESYRARPHKGYRSWTADEVPVGCLLKGPWGKAVLTHTEDKGELMKMCAPDGKSGRQWFVEGAFLIDQLKYSVDGGKTWHLCGVLEDKHE